LRRAACDPRLVALELGRIGAKVQEFEQLVLELVAGRHKAPVFRQFTDVPKRLGNACRPRTRPAGIWTAARRRPSARVASTPSSKGRASCS
jgi:hypothetical protein